MNPSLRISTSLSPQEGVNRLTHALENQPAIRVSPTLTMRKQIVDGHVSVSRIRLFVREGLANSYTAHFSGRFSEVDGVTVLEGEFHHAPMIRFHLALVRGFAIALGVAMSGFSLYGLFTTGQLGLVLGVVIPLAFTIGVCHFVPRVAKLETSRLDKFIRSAIGAK
jgi:hypothetical protein